MSAIRSLIVFAVFCCSVSPVVAKPHAYELASSHCMIFFKLKHDGISYSYGMLQSPTGSIVNDPDNPAGCSFQVDVNVKTIVSGHPDRDKSLHGKDFFKADKFPVLSFKSTQVRAIGEKSEKRYAMSGMLTMLGVSKPVLVEIVEVGRGTSHDKPAIGFEGNFTFKRSDFGMNAYLDSLGDEISVMVSLEAGLADDQAAAEILKRHAEMKKQPIVAVDAEPADNPDTES